MHAVLLLIALVQLSIAPLRVGGFALSVRNLQSMIRHDAQAVRVFDGAVGTSICRHLDRAAAAMGGGHVLFDRRRAAESPIEQIIDSCLQRADDTARCLP